MNFEKHHPLEFCLAAFENDESLTEAQNDAVFKRIAQALPFALETQAPPAALKAKIFSAVRASEQAPVAESHRADAAQANVQLWKQWSAPAASSSLFVLRGDEGEWEKTGVEGVEVKQLFVDQERDYVTMLVRMQPGSAYPSHRHGGFEECYVLHGDLSVGENVMRAGDYQRAEGGSVHVVQSTSQGCLLFIVSSQHDELLA